MDQTKRTEHPWHLGESNSGKHFIYAKGSDAPLKPEVKLNKVYTKEMYANALLMAASPDLLEALENTLAWLNHSDVRYLISNKLGEMAALHSTINQAHAAISKATRTVAPKTPLPSPALHIQNTNQK
jgi:hypothetical protein